MQPSSDSVEGTWQLVRAELAGETAPEGVAEKTTMQFAGGRYAVRFGGQVMDEGTFELGGVVTRHTMLLRGTSGPNAGRMIPCIYQLRGDMLRVCFGFNGVAPTDYDTNTSNQRYSATYRRA